MKQITVRELIETLKNVKEEDLDKQIISISTYCGWDRPCDYAIRLEDYSEIQLKGTH